MLISLKRQLCLSGFRAADRKHAKRLNGTDQIFINSCMRFFVKRIPSNSKLILAKNKGFNNTFVLLFRDQTFVFCT